MILPYIAPLHDHIIECNKDRLDLKKPRILPPFNIMHSISYLMQVRKLISHPIQGINLRNQPSLKLLATPGKILKQALTFLNPFGQLLNKLMNMAIKADPKRAINRLRGINRLKTFPPINFLPKLLELLQRV